MSQREITPHTIQQEALIALETSRRQGQKRAASVLPSGMGKTHLAAFDAKRLNARRILYIAHRREILEQAEATFRSVYSLQPEDQQTGFIISEKKEFDRPMLFATIQTIHRPETLEKLSEIEFDYVTLDEYHHAAAKTYIKVLDALKFKFFHGITATFYRYDRKDLLKGVDQNVTYSMELEAGIKSGQLAPFYYNALYDNIDYSDIEWNGHKYKEKDLNKKLIIDRRDNQILKEYQDSIQKTGRSTLVFCVSIKHTHRMAAKFQKNNINAVALTYETETPQRHAAISAFRAGRIQVLCVRDILNEGVDFPEASAIMLLRPTSSKTVFYQQIGRGLRKAPGKTDVQIFDFVGNYHNAYRVREWLGFATQVQHHVGAMPQKPEYMHNVSYVYFDRRVLDIFELQRNAGRPQDQDLIDEYIHISKTVGFNPTQTDLQNRRAFQTKHHIFPRYSVNAYRRHFGRWSNFMRSVIDIRYAPPNARIEKERLEEMYLNLASKLGRQYISSKEWVSEYDSRISLLNKKFGGITALRRHMQKRLDDINLPSERCSHCAKPFVRPNRRNGATKLYCSHECRTNAISIRAIERRLDLLYRCVICGKEFTRRDTGIARTRLVKPLCSKECKAANRSKVQHERYRQKRV